VSPAGAADPLALRMGNVLVGNHSAGEDEHAAGPPADEHGALESMFGGLKLQFKEACVIAITGLVITKISLHPLMSFILLSYYIYISFC